MTRRQLGLPDVRFSLILLTLLAVRTTAAAAADVENPLLGVWVGESMQAGGQQVPAEAAKHMRWEFKADKLLMRGNSKRDPDHEEKCTYKTDLEKSPRELDFTPEGMQREKTVRGIFKVDGDQLTVCMQHAAADGARPSEFKSPAGSRVVLMVLKKQPAK